MTNVQSLNTKRTDSVRKNGLDSMKKNGLNLKQNQTQKGKNSQFSSLQNYLLSTRTKVNTSNFSDFNLLNKYGRKLSY